MTNTALIETAVDLANKIAATAGIMMSNTCIRCRVENWYNYTDFTNPEILAACAIDSDYNSNLSYSWIMETYHYYYPSIEDDIPIWEIEAAQHDVMW